VTAIGRAGPEPAPGQGADAVVAHETFNPPAADRPALGPQGGMHARGTVATMVGGMDPPDVVQELTVGG
jgi:hypothetical protein